MSTSIEVSTRDCLEWDMYIGTHGYGVLSKGGKQYLAHRLVWEENHGPIPPGMHVLHRCDNKPCINPEHLFLGTSADNMQDKIRKGRDYNQKKTHCIHGHEFTPQNTYRRPSGGRKCRACIRETDSYSKENTRKAA
jgi:hypothetical protein